LIQATWPGAGARLQPLVASIPPKAVISFFGTSE
jgi:hypothetical protein